MTEIKIKLENENVIVKNKDYKAMGEVDIRIKGDTTVIANELSIALYEIFLENPDIVTRALDICSQRINNHIHKEEE